jgi:dipeptidyl-peptidase-3
MVACHELLGHGSGRLFLETEDGIHNFNAKDPPQNLLTGSPIESWYHLGETWQSVFGRDAGSYEECRADGVSLLLVTHKPILETFGYRGDTDIKADDSKWLHFGWRAVFESYENINLTSLYSHLWRLASIHTRCIERTFTVERGD